MYLSWRSASFIASSVVIAWFWPSGSSVTRNVERFERASTFVWTLRFPHLVGRAVGTCAASSLTSCGLGLSYTRFACGSRNSIFATSRQLLVVGPDWGILAAVTIARMRARRARAGDRPALERASVC